MAEIMLQNPQTLLALPLLWFLVVAFAWRRRFKPFGPFLLRLTIIVLVVLALSRPILPAPQINAEGSQPRLVLLVDQSASLNEKIQAAFRAETVRLIQQFPDSHVLYFADQPVLVSGPGLTLLDGPDTELPLNPEISNLSAALSMGAEMLNEQPGRLVLLSDGVPTEGDIAEAVARLARQNIPIDVLTLNGTGLQIEPQNEVRLVNLTVPQILREGETFDVEVTVHTVFATEVSLELIQDEVLLATDVVPLEPGLNIFTFEASAEEIGPHTFQATATAIRADDGQAVNNSYSGFSQVFPMPQILIVSEDVGQAIRFGNQLDEVGFVSHRINPADLPDRLPELEPFAGMVLLNVSAHSLELEQMIAVQEFVRSLGRGLLVTGGRESFSLGDYEDTPLADLLPVLLEPPPREERPPVALLLIMDHSGSMVEKHEPATRLAMAKEAAILGTDILGPDDLIGILMFDNEYEWVVPFRPVSDGAAMLQIQQDILTIPGGGGTRILQALEVGLSALAEQEAFTEARHAVLLSDGKSFDGSKGIEDYNKIIDDALAANITLSSIAIGTGADQPLLTYLAERGQGRYHFAAVPDELPALTIAESDILRSNAIQEGEAYRPIVFAPHSILRGFFTASSAVQEAEKFEVPSLNGYVAQTPRPWAEVALQVGPGDPLLSVWGYGLGRVAAWTSDTGSEWTDHWRTWPASARFWGQIVGYTLPGPDLGLLQLRTELEPNSVVTLTADGITAIGQTVDLAYTQAILTTPGGREAPLTLRQVSPGRYQQRLRLPDPGAYQLDVTQARGDEPDETATNGFVVPYPAEYGLSADGLGEPLLREIAANSGGRTFSPGELLYSTNCEPQLEDCGADNLQSEIELWPWLLQIALILWPIEIAWRRWGRLRIQ